MTKEFQDESQELTDDDLDQVDGGRVLMRLKNAAVLRDRVSTSAGAADVEVEGVLTAQG